MTISDTNKTRLRTEKQSSEFAIGVLQPVTVFSFQVDQVFTSSDMVYEFDYDNPTGDYEDVLPGQTLYLGSTPGAFDIGICWIRKELTDTKIYIGESSDIVFSNDIYGTVVDSFDIWAKPIKIDTDGNIYVDVDIEYTDQHENYDPIPILGGNVVVDTESYPVVIGFPEVADSYILEGSITNYLLEATAGSVSDETTTNPSLTINSYPTNGYIRVSLTLTSDQGKTYTGYRYVLVYDNDNRPIEDFSIEEHSCERNSGGWRLRIKLNNSSNSSLFRHRVLAILYAKKERYGDEYISIGTYEGRENILFSGWVDYYTVNNDPEFTPRIFDIYTANYWMNKMASFVMGVRSVQDTPELWTDIEDLTVDKGLYHFLHFRTTATSIVDVYLTGNTLYTPSCKSPSGTLWAQIIDISYLQILAMPFCNHNGKLYVYVPYNLVPEDNRSSLSDFIIDLEEVDYERNIQMKRILPVVSQVILNGISYDENGNAVPLFSLSPGNMPSTFGEPLPVTNLLLESQEQANELAGLVFGNSNPPYSPIPLRMNGNNRFFDIAPMQHATISLPEYSGVIIPENIDINYDGGKPVITVTFLVETFEKINTNGNIPDGNGGYIGFGDLGKLPPIEPIAPPSLSGISFPPSIPDLVSTPCANDTLNFFPIVWSRSSLEGDDDTKLIAYCPFHCYLRASGSFATSFLELRGAFLGDSDEHYAVYAVSGGSRVSTGTIVGQSWNFARIEFSPISDLEIDGFEIELEEGLGSDVEYSPGATVTSGTVAGTDSSGDVLAVTEDEYYSIEGTAGPYYPDEDELDSPSWTIEFKQGGGSFSGPNGNSIYSGEFFLNVGSGLFAEQISANYARVYFKASTTNITVRCASNFFLDNAGNMGYILRLANVLGRSIQLNTSTINNVCAG